MYNENGLIVIFKWFLLFRPIKRYMSYVCAHLNHSCLYLYWLISYELLSWTGLEMSRAKTNKNHNEFKDQN